MQQYLDSITVDNPRFSATLHYELSNEGAVLVITQVGQAYRVPMTPSELMELGKLTILALRLSLGESED